MEHSVDFVTLYINHIGICESVLSNTTRFNPLLKNAKQENIEVNQLFYNSAFYTPIYKWLKETNAIFWEDVINDGSKDYLVSIQPVKMNTVVAIVTIRASAASKKSEELKHNYELALGKSNVGLWTWPDSTKGDAWWSESFYNLLGYVNNEFEPSMKSFLELIHPEDLIEFSQSMATFSQNDHESNPESYRETRMRTKSGEYRYLLFSAKAHKADAVLSFSGTVVNIDKLKTIEKKLIESDSRLQLALEATDGWVFEWDMNSDTYFLSHVHVDILGYNKEDISFTRDAWLALIHPEDRTVLAESFRKHIEDKSPYMEAEFRVKSISGNYVWLLERGKIWEEDNQGNAAKYIGTHINITKRKNIELQLIQRDEQLKVSMEAGNMGTWSWNIITNEVTWSDHVLIIFGLKQNEFKGDYQSYLNLIPEAERGYIEQVLEDVLIKKHDNFSFEHSIYLADGSKRLLYCKGKLYKNAEGVAYRMMGVVLDITKENELRLLLEQTKERYRSVIEAMSEGVIIMDLTGKIIDHNTAATTIIGYESETETLTGKDLSFGPGEAVREDMSLFPMNDFPGIKTLETGQPYKNVTLGWIKPSKDVIWLSINSEPVLNEFGKQVAVVCSYSDVTERYISLKDLKVKNRQLEDFAHITSHNLRSPISNLSILLDYFEAATDETEKKEYLLNLKHVSDTLLSTIQVLAESLKIQREFVDDECEVSFEEIFQNVVTLLSGQIQQADLKFSVNFDACRTIHYSPTYLQSIFINLISNAIKYRSLSRTAIVSIRTYTTEKGKAILKVKDNGIGIDLKKNGHKIFGLYKTFHANIDSRGVGLYMTKRQVETLGGTIEVESEINVGTTFTISF